MDQVFNVHCKIGNLYNKGSNFNYCNFTMLDDSKNEEPFHPQERHILRWVIVLKKNTIISLNSLPYNKFLYQSKLKMFADDKINKTENLKFVLGRLENIAGKKHFLLFPQ